LMLHGPNLRKHWGRAFIECGVTTCFLARVLLEQETFSFGSGCYQKKEF